MANFIFTQATNAIADGTIDWEGDTIRVLLVDSTNDAVASRDTAVFVGDLNVSTSEYDGSGYSRQTLAGKATTINAGSNRTELEADDATFGATVAAGSAAAAGAIVYKFITSDAASPVIGYFDSGDFPQNGTGSAFTIQWGSGIVFTYTAS
jgi:hypothetical protein